MGKNSAIEWTDHSFNPWLGCTKISVGPQGACEHCYAEGWAKRSGLVTWNGPRRRTSEATWREPLKIHAAIPDGQRQRIFCASLADVFDNEVPEEWRFDLFQLIRQTPRLDWLLLTKRIGNAKAMLMEHGMDGSYNIWVGATVVTQEEADRDIPKLLSTPARVRFLSCEPLQSAIDLVPWLGEIRTGFGTDAGIDWAICGGESGPRPRLMKEEWASALRQQCKLYGVAFFMKQLGGHPDKRESLESIPEDLRVREFPKVNA